MIPNLFRTFPHIILRTLTRKDLLRGERRRQPQHRARRTTSICCPRRWTPPRPSLNQQPSPKTRENFEIRGTATRKQRGENTRDNEECSTPSDDKEKEWTTSAEAAPEYGTCPTLRSSGIGTRTALRPRGRSFSHRHFRRSSVGSRCLHWNHPQRQPGPSRLF